MMRRCLVPIGDLTFWVQPWDRPFAQTWIAWHTRPHLEIAEEPPADHWIRELWDLHTKLQQSPGFDEQVEYFRAIQEIWLQELPMQGYVGNIPQLVVAKNGLMGIGRAPGAGPEGGGWPWDCCLTVYENIVDNSTFYWDVPEDHML
jgi:hypothetical protein